MLTRLNIKKQLIKQVFISETRSYSSKSLYRDFIRKTHAIPVVQEMLARQKVLKTF